MNEELPPAAAAATDSTAYDELIALLERHGAAYRVIDHAPEGRTEIVSQLRGHPASEAAKCIVVMAKIGRKITRYVLAVVPGDARLDLAAIKTLLGATYVGFATPSIAEELGRTVSGTILPFPLDDRLELIVDPRVLATPELFFNAARLDRSLAVRADDFARIAQPRVARIATGGAAS
jgi:Ala-tRNA(Pro) deacylase